VSILRWAEEHIAEQRDDPLKSKPVARYEGEHRVENEMRKTLLSTAAMAAVSLTVGFGGIAAAQSQMGNESGKGMSGTAPEAAAPGTMHEQKGAGPNAASSGDKTMSPSGGPPRQSSERNGKQNERLGQSPRVNQAAATVLQCIDEMEVDSDDPLRGLTCCDTHRKQSRIGDGCHT